jgi:hypothetical protein
MQLNVVVTGPEKIEFLAFVAPLISFLIFTPDKV